MLDPHCVAGIALSPVDAKGFVCYFCLHFLASVREIKTLFVSTSGTMNPGANCYGK